MRENLFDVVAVNLDTNKVRLIANGKTKENAEAIQNMAVMRRGVDEEFFAACTSRKYKEGDLWTGNC